MTIVPETATYEEALAAGFIPVPTDKIKELKKSTKMAMTAVDCNNKKNLHRVCSKFVDPEGHTVYSYCDENGVCGGGGNLFLRMP